MSRTLGVALLAAVGCTGRFTASTAITTAGGGSSSSNASSAGGGSSAGSSQGTGSSGSTGGASSSNAGSTTGATPSPYFDGGYVFCSAAAADGGTRRWMCQPGTYFCDEGNAGSCLQCRDDADCTDSSLPTYDPRRPRCDLASGVAGYQGFCQQCIADSDCAGNTEGVKCDLDPNFASDAIQPPIVTLGFEACGPLETDCRALDGPICRQFDETCDQANGRCELPRDSCASDQDCAGRFAGPYLPEPFCVDGGCSTCDGGVCPSAQGCEADYQCGNPADLPGGLACDTASATCRLILCTDDSQCGGILPLCLGIDGGRTALDGTPEGICGCDDTSQCGDAGLICIPSSTDAPGTKIVIPTRAGGMCGVPCSSPLSPACSAMTGYDSCYPGVGLCGPCVTEVDCLNSFGSGGPICTSIFAEGPPPHTGACACLLDSDCPYGYSCVGVCVPTLPRCTNESCGSAFCDFESGQCSQDAGHAAPSTPCVSNYECRSDQQCIAGSCIGCVDDSDCLAYGPTTSTLCCHIDAACYQHFILPNTCAPYCHTDADCIGNQAGSKCELDAGTDSAATYFQCGCGSDADCAGNPRGTHCVSDPADPQFGTCLCQTSADCDAGELCSGTYCTSTCYQGQCPNDFPCGQSATCQPRCDGRRECPASAPVCDIGNVLGLNGDGLYGDAGDVVWCYECLDSRDCPGGLGCRAGQCAQCTYGGGCFAGTVCALDGLCHATCDAGACAAGQFCDLLDQAGSGSNVCYGCTSSVDCPNGEGCDSATHTCGTCEGPTARGGPYDCPPDAVCSNYRGGGTGACLQNCDREPCPASASICTVLPDLTPDHAYCFDCLSDLDCEDGGWCDRRVYQCKREDEQ